MARTKEVTIVTHRDIFQEQEKAKDRYTQEYQDLSALIVLDRSDMKLIGAEDGDMVLVENEWGSVVVKAKLSDEEDAHSGIAFMPNSPWSNQVVSGDTGGSGIPDFKKVVAKVSSAEGDVISLKGLAEQMRV